MSISPPTLKNGRANHHTPNDAVYLKLIRLSCCFCNSRGPNKIRKNLWRLHCHFLNQHKLENYHEIETQLYKLIESGVLR